MSQITTILRGAQKTYETPVLFQSAGAWVRQALAEAGFSEGVVETAGDNVLLIGAPCPELTAAASGREPPGDRRGFHGVRHPHAAARRG